MKRFRGFRLGRKVVKLWSKMMRPMKRLRISGYERLAPPERRCEGGSKTITKIRSWGRALSKRLRRQGSSGCACLVQPPLDAEKPLKVPKGHLAVYVGQKDDDPHRYLVPIIYFNHPLFGELLREAEQEFGYNHPGGITIPCRISDFENVQMKIAAGKPGQKVRFR